MLNIRKILFFKYCLLLFYCANNLGRSPVLIVYHPDGERWCTLLTTFLRIRREKIRYFSFLDEGHHSQIWCGLYSPFSSIFVSFRCTVSHQMTHLVLFRHLCFCRSALAPKTILQEGHVDTCHWTSDEETNNVIVLWTGISRISFCFHSQRRQHQQQDKWSTYQHPKNRNKQSNSSIQYL